MAKAKAKKPTSKQSPAPKVRRIKKSSFKLPSLSLPRVNFSQIKSNYQKEFTKHPSLYPTLGLIAALFIILLLAFIFYRGFFLAGSVNGRIITTPEFYSELTKSGGEQIFENLIRNTLVEQEAKKQNLTVSNEEIDARVSRIEKQIGGKESLDRALEQSNTSLEDLKKQLRIQLLAEKILEKDIQVSSEEIEKYKKENASLVEGQSDDDIKEQLRSQKFNEKFAEWYDNLKKNANIQKYF